MATGGGPTSSVTPGNLPNGVPPKPEPKDFEEPVGWLFGRQFIASLKYVLLYAAFKGKLDSRDWMKARVLAIDSQTPDTDSREPQSADEEFWFDYISDTGDGQKAMYSIAYLCMSDLSVSTKLARNEEVSCVAQPNVAELSNKGRILLHRGAFLFVGGDTSYHISDYATLGRRFQNPFWWAFSDLVGRTRSVKQTRLLFGIPGNHDYYDSLDGFNRQFRRPATGDEVGPDERQPLLKLPTFQREQEASYVALRLPFDWWFWGLDTEDGEIDFRQLGFFRHLSETVAPKKLIIATPEPTTAFGKFASEDSNRSKTFKALHLERPFLKDPEPLPDEKCRVDLSGDIHHYARYWGPAPGTGETSNYISVMAGGGGAFFHPSHTYVNEVDPTIVYPDANSSRKETAQQIFWFLNIVKGGFVWLFGFVMAFALFFSASFPQSSKDVVDSFPLWTAVGVSPPAETQTPEPPATNLQPMPRYIWGPNAPSRPVQFIAWGFSLLVSLAALIGALIYSWKIFEKPYEPEKDFQRHPPERERVPFRRRLTVWGIVLFSFLTLTYAILGLKSFEPSLTRFGRSIIIFFALVWAVLAVIQSVKYSGWLFEESYHGNIRTWHYWPIWVLLIMSIVEVGASLWFFGKHESSYLVSDLVQLLVLVGVILGLTYFAIGPGGSLKKGIGKVGFLILGASHALVQLAVPFLLVRKGHLIWAPVVGLVIVVVFQFLGREFAKLDSGWPLAIVAVIFVTLLILTPFYFPASSLNIPQSPWKAFFLCLYAGLIGAGTSCVLFGWYLAVALGFNGHNNEAGGAARIEGFKQLIRFRLNREGLTGFVIGFDKAETDGRELAPKLVDVFRISCGTPSERRAS